MATRRSASGVSSSLVCETGGEEDEKIITVGIRRAISAASWSGPLGIAVSLPPASITAWRAIAMSRSSNGIGGIDHTCFSSTSQPWSWAACSQAARASESMAASASGSRWRWSSSISVRPGTVVITPGSLVARPTVQTPSCLKPTSRIARAAWAVAENVSRRRPIGVAPACAVCPVNTASWRSAPKARAPLAGPAHERAPARRAPAVRLLAQRLERREHAERAVEPAAGRHRVHVGAHDHEAVRLAGEVGPEVARLVDRDLDRELVEARAQELARLRPLVGPAHAAGPVGAAGQLGELAEVGEDPVGVH